MKHQVAAAMPKCFENWCSRFDDLKNVISTLSCSPRANASKLLLTTGGIRESTKNQDLSLNLFVKQHEVKRS